jgi:hypothetical protein
MGAGLLLAALAATGLAAEATRSVEVQKTFPAEAPCTAGDTHTLRFTFPVDGGVVTGLQYGSDRGVLEHSGDGGDDLGGAELGSDLPDELKFECRNVRFTGSLVAGEVATGARYDLALKVRLKGSDGTTREETWRGRLPPDGKGSLKVGDQTWRLAYPAYRRGCVPNLEHYTGKGHDKLVEMLRDEALQRAKDLLLEGAQKIWTKAFDVFQRWEFSTDRYGYHLKHMVTGARTPDDSLYQRIAAKLVPDKAGKIPALGLLDEAIGQLGNTLNLFEVGTSAFIGDHEHALEKGIPALLGMYSNAAGMAVMFVEAAHEDWKRFATGAYEKQFRLFYEHHYTQGGHPDSELARKSRKERLKHFMEDVMIVLKEGGAMGAGGAPQFRKMLADYAYRRLKLKGYETGKPWQSGDDFEVVEDGGRYRFRNKYAGTVLINLFRDFERVYASDLHAAQMRKIAAHQTKMADRLLRKIEDRAVAAEEKHFNKAWRTQSAYRRAFCAIVQHLESKGLLAVKK